MTLEPASVAAKATVVRAADVQLYGVYEISKLLASPGRLEVTLAQVMHLLASFLDMRHGLIAAERSGTSSSRQRG